MIRHLLQLVWNRKRSNLPIALEILLSFLVLTAVTTIGGVLRGQLLQAPRVRRRQHLDDHDRDERGGPLVGRPRSRTGRRRPRPRTPDRARQRAPRPHRPAPAGLGDMPEVEAVAGAAITPYSANSWESDIEVGGRRYRYGASAGTDDLAKVMGITVTRGRWFTQGRRWRRVAAGGRQRAARGGDVPRQGSRRPVRRRSKRLATAAASRMRIVGRCPRVPKGRRVRRPRQLPLQPGAARRCRVIEMEPSASS